MVLPHIMPAIPCGMLILNKTMYQKKKRRYCIPSLSDDSGLSSYPNKTSGNPFARIDIGSSWSTLATCAERIDYY